MSLDELWHWFDKQPLFKIIRQAIINDDYLWIVVHGPPRSSKSTLMLWILWYIYNKDWNKVYQAITFKLEELMNNIIKGIPIRVPTKNKLHKRVPIIGYDDFSVHSNKADTQHSSAWDIFKGGFDALGTEIGVLLATMVNAESPTSQLQNKYNIEVIVPRKGVYKVDRVVWLQDYRGFRTKMKKWCIVDNATFPKIPDKYYKPYDKRRMSLTKEVYVRIQDAMSIDKLDIVLKMIKPSDIQLLKLIDLNGPIYYKKAREDLKELYKQTVIRCKSRGLIITSDHGSYNYKLEITPLAIDVLESLKNKDTARKKSIYKKEPRY